jgi:hypothetical protein
MTEAEKEDKRTGGFNVESKFSRTLLVLLTVFLVFGGPTYFVYLAVNGLNLDLAIAGLSGFALFVVGLVLLWFLIRKRIIR